jgi:Ca-activated chloride channel homolog
MKSLRKIALVGAAVAVLFTVGRAQGQNPTPPPAASPAPTIPAPGTQAPGQLPRQGTISTTTSIVVVPVTVKDRNGNLVADLKRDEFRVFEDGIEQQIQRLNTDSMPISMVVLIDNDLKQKDEQQVEPSLVSIVGGMSPDDEAFICRFDQYFHEGKGFTADQDSLITQLRRTVLASKTSAPPPGDPFNGPTINNAPAPGAPDTAANGSLVAIKGQPTKALDDAVFDAALLLKDRDSRKRRKVILLISDGQDGAKFNTHKYDEVREELLKQDITVYCVATGSAYFDRKFSRLVNYAHDTGGDIFYGAKADSFSEFYSRITEEARNQYTLIYYPRGDKKVDYHTIEVRVRREGLTVLARDGYYGGTFANAPQK